MASPSQQIRANDDLIIFLNAIDSLQRCIDNESHIKHPVLPAAFATRKRTHFVTFAVYSQQFVRDQLEKATQLFGYSELNNQEFN